jgi:hypothetical protein
MRLSPLVSAPAWMSACRKAVSGMLTVWADHMITANNSGTIRMNSFFILFIFIRVYWKGKRQIREIKIPVQPIREAAPPLTGIK